MFHLSHPVNMASLVTEAPCVVGVPGSVAAEGGRDGEVGAVRASGRGGSLAQATAPLVTALVSQTGDVDDVEEGGLAPLALDALIMSSQLQVRTRRVRNRVYAVDPGERMYNTILYQAVTNK